MSDDNRSWYLNQKGKATGPFKFSDLKAMAAQGKLKGHDLVFREGSTEWKRAYDWPELIQDVFAEEDRSSLSRLIRLPEEEKSAAKSDQWVLLVRVDGEKEVRFQQKGPYSTDEIKKLVLEEKIKASDHIWKKGAPKWVPLYEIPEFQAKNLKINEEAKKSLAAVEEVPPYPAIVEKEMKKPVEVKVAAPAQPVALQADPFFAGPAADADEVTDPFINVDEIEKKEKGKKSEPLVKPLSVAPPVTEPFHLQSKELTKSDAQFTLRDIKKPAIPEAKISNPISEVKPPSEPAPIVVAPVVVIPPAREEPPPVPQVAPKPQIPVIQFAKGETSSPDDRTVIAPSGIPGVPDAKKDLQLEETRIMHVPVSQPQPSMVAKSMPTPKEPTRNPSEDFDDEFTETNFRPPPPDRSLWARIAPVAAVVLLVIFAVGIWATFRTKAPFPSELAEDGRENIPVVQQQPEKPIEQAFDSEYDPVDSLKRMKPRLPVATEEPPQRAVAPAPAPPPPAPQPVARNNDRSDLDNMAPGLHFNTQTQMLEIVAPFRKGDSIRVRIEGKTGQILDLPALLTRMEVSAQRDGFHKIPVSQLRLPRGDFHVTAQFGSTRLTKVLGWGKDVDSYGELIANHRKMIILDQQNERKKLIRAIREFGALLARAESQGSNANGLRELARDLESKTPSEVRSVRMTRNELIFPEMWERLAQQWEKTQNMLKEGGRNPASTTELAKSKREVSPMESEIRNKSMWE